MTAKVAGRAGIAVVLATALAIPAEGVRQVVYYDPPGIPTVCFGHTGADVDKSKTYSMNECYALLDKDMTVAVNAVEACVPGLPPEVLAAFGDAVFNMGPTIACNPAKSTAARKLKANDLVGACNELPKWDKARIAGVAMALPGLTKRRHEERELCLKGANKGA